MRHLYFWFSIKIPLNMISNFQKQNFTSLSTKILFREVIFFWLLQAWNWLRGSKWFSSTTTFISSFCPWEKASQKIIVAHDASESVTRDFRWKRQLLVIYLKHSISFLCGLKFGCFPEMHVQGGVWIALVMTWDHWNFTDYRLKEISEKRILRCFYLINSLLLDQRSLAHIIKGFRIKLE